MSRGRIFPLQELHHLHTGLLGQDQAGGVRGGDRPLAGEPQPQRLGETVHRVGCKHPSARPASRTGGTLETLQLCLGHFAARHGTHRHEHVRQVHRFAVQLTGQHRAAADQDGRQIQTGGSHQHARDDLVTVGDEHQRVKSVGPGHHLHRIGDQLAAGEGVFHPHVVHRQAVADADGVALKGCAASGAYAGLDCVSDLAQPRVTGNRLVVRVDHADKGLVHLPVGTPQRPEQRAMGRALDTTLDDITLHSHDSRYPLTKRPPDWEALCLMRSTRLHRFSPNRRKLLNQEHNKNQNNDHGVG
jgi:hypothetical protein